MTGAELRDAVRVIQRAYRAQVYGPTKLSELLDGLADEIERLERERDEALAALANGGGHLRPKDRQPCAYMADRFCNKCGWVSPFREEKPDE